MTLLLMSYTNAGSQPSSSTAGLAAFQTVILITASR